MMTPEYDYETIVHLGLRPWRHYLPFKRDLSDLRENARWCFEHDDECAEIARRASRRIKRLASARHERTVQSLVLEALVSWQLGVEAATHGCC